MDSPIDRQWRIALLDPKRHDRDGFSCGAPSLDEYLRRRAGQDAKRRLAATYVLTEEGSDIIAGYYTLSAMHTNAGELPAEIEKKFPRYPYLPATLIGRLAVSSAFQGKGLGGVLLRDATLRAKDAAAHVGSVAVVVEALDAAAVRFYEHHGFLKLPGQDRRLFLPMASIA